LITKDNSPIVPIKNTNSTDRGAVKANFAGRVVEDVLNVIVSQETLTVKGLDSAPSKAIACWLYLFAALDLSNVTLGVALRHGNGNSSRNEGSDGKEVGVHSENRDDSDRVYFENGSQLKNCCWRIEA